MSTWLYEEMPRINPSIFVHEIKTYLDAKPVRQRLRQIHLRKVVAIKAKVEKLLRADFIYPIPLTDWVSNIILVNKKQGTIIICIDYRILIELVLKTIIQPPISIKLLMIVMAVKCSPLWMVFPVTIKSTYSL